MLQLLDFMTFSNTDSNRVRQSEWSQGDCGGCQVCSGQCFPTGWHLPGLCHQRGASDIQDKPDSVAGMNNACVHKAIAN